MTPPLLIFCNLASISVALNKVQAELTPSQSGGSGKEPSVTWVTFSCDSLGNWEDLLVG